MSLPAVGRACISVGDGRDVDNIHLLEYHQLMATQKRLELEFVPSRVIPAIEESDSLEQDPICNTVQGPVAVGD